MRYTSGLMAVLLFALCMTNALYSSEPPWETEYKQGVIVFKLFPEYYTDLPDGGAASLNIPQIDEIMESIGAYHVERSFLDCLPPVKNGTDLRPWYNLYFPETVSVQDVTISLEKLAQVEFAEPWYIYRILLDHNDPNRNLQYGLDLCQANDAHDISTGDPNAVVAIVDTGVDSDHPDLVPNRWINPGEDLNGNGVIDNNERNNVDDDRSGKVDDFYGWDFVSSDNNPNDESGHGTHCAGIASARTNNRIGIASVGFSCSIMAVRSGSGLQVTHGYQGIEYAARMGAEVISCSWGGYQSSNYGRQVTLYAEENDALVTASAGNDNISTRLYPAAYSDVVAVAATDQNDRRAGFSNYGDWVSISAPGVSIVSTYPSQNQPYVYMDGTSMSCPFVASVAILIRACYPNLDVEQTRQLLFEGADDIDDINVNYRGQLGAGRINAYESLLLGDRPIIALSELEVIHDDDDNGRLDQGETVSFAITLSNGEDAHSSEELSVSLISDDLSLWMPVNPIEFPNLGPGESFRNDEDPFVVEVSDDAIPHTTWITVIVEGQPGNLHLEKTYELIIGHPDILIIDDDDGQEIDEFYTSAIEEMGQGWVKWNVAESYTPSFSVMDGYPMVIWFTGTSGEPLDELDLWELETALQEGANVLLIGKYIGDYPVTHFLLEEYFGAMHEADSVAARWVSGVTNDGPITRNMQMLLFGDGGNNDGRNSPSSCQPVNGADTLAVYSISDGGAITGMAGTYRYNENTGQRTAYMGFSFESVSGVQETTTRSETLSRLYEWFGGRLSTPLEDDGVPLVFALDPAYPNPFNSMVRLNFSIPSYTSYRLSVYDLSGRELALLGEGNIAAGPHSLSWDARNIPSGLYIARITKKNGAAIERKLILAK